MGPGLALGLGIGSKIIGGIFGSRRAKRAERRAKRQQKIAAKEMNRLRNIYANLDTSNPFVNMENTMEDLTINQKQSEFQAQQFQQTQANIMAGLRDAAGSSGIAALAQSLAQQGQIAAQKSAADIGAQEAANVRSRQQMEANIQAQERQGDIMSRNWERDKYATLMGMSQAETAAYRQQTAQAQAQGTQAMTNMFGGIGDVFMTGVTSGAFGKPKVKPE